MGIAAIARKGVACTYRRGSVELGGFEAMWRRRTQGRVLAAMAVASVMAPVAAVGAIPEIILPVRASQLPDPVPATPALRPRTVHTATARPMRDSLDWLLSRTQVRYGRAIADFYPLQGVGLHLSGGTRFNVGYDPSTFSPDTRIALTFDPRRPSGAIALRDGFERFAPIAMVGYSHPVGTRLVAGVDVGAMVGRAVTLYPFIDRPVPSVGPLRDSRALFNPVVDVTLACAF